MLVIRGDTRVADIYLGEFMRSFSHHAFREALTFGNPPLNHLHIKPAAWQKHHFDPSRDAFLRRRYFASPVDRDRHREARAAREGDFERRPRVRAPSPGAACAVAARSRPVGACEGVTT